MRIAKEVSTSRRKPPIGVSPAAPLYGACTALITAAGSGGDAATCALANAFKNET